jgi:hypothetical protein
MSELIRMGARKSRDANRKVSQGLLVIFERGQAGSSAHISYLTSRGEEKSITSKPARGYRENVG